jgi:putative glycerol-1-phosphate prenyltransferase
LGTVFEYLSEVRQRRGAGYLVLLDPDRLSPEELEQRALAAAEAGADAILIGTSLMFSASRNARAYARLKARVQLPLIGFPGDAGQVAPGADALFFLSLISGRNPELLIGQQVRAAPLLKEAGVEVIATGYMLVESGSLTSVEFMSGTRPIPRHKADIAMAHALAARYLGMKLLYLETGSGAGAPVPDEMVRAVAEYAELPVVVGGGIRDGQTARAKVEAGAGFVVTGTVVEEDQGRLRELSAAVHVKG